MKKLLILITFIMISSLISAGITYETQGDELRISYVNQELTTQKDMLSQVIALPALSAEVIVNSCEVSVIDQDGDLIRTESIDGDEFVQIESSFVMRELYAHRVKVTLKDSSEEYDRIVKNIDFTIKPIERVQVPTRISKAFLPTYRALVDNFENSYLRNIVEGPSKMLIITHESLISDIQLFTDWKNAKGIATEVVTIEDIGSQSSQIKDYIQSVYDNSEIPPDYVLLTGDMDEVYTIPSFYIHSGTEYDVTDHPYTLLEGDDYFPEMIIGRFSFDQPFEFLTMIAKVLHYEKTPFMGSTHWFEDALLVAGNWSSSPPTPSTPVKVTKWLRDKMVNYGYNNITEIYYPPTYPGTPQIISAIDNGVGIVTYRGWGDANGWHYPYFHKENIDDLNNNPFLPVMTSIVCNTGDFANSSVDPCFGEKWLRVGSPSNPQGGVVFVGPSDLHTNTKYNNSIFSGFYAGMLDEDNLIFGSDVLRGKIELYNNFPLDREPEGKVEFYFHVYNILGDPSLTMWTTVPQTINCTLPAEINKGTNYLEIDLPDLEGGIVTAKMEGSIFSTAIVENGQATLYFNLENSDQIEITITKPNYYPFIQTIDVITDDIELGLFDFDTNGNVITGEEFQLDLTLKNYGTLVANNVTADLSCTNSYVNILTTSANFGNIDPGSTAMQGYDVEILPGCPDNTVIQFDLDISGGSTAKFDVLVNGLIFEITSIVVNNEEEVLLLLEDNSISVSIKNIGIFDVSNLQAELFSQTPDATITSSQFSVGNVAVDATSMAEFSIQLSGECYIGQNLPFYITLIDENLLETNIYFSMEAGMVENTAPTGPDSFGYYALDSYDVFYQNCPEYFWKELDPLEGGDGTVIQMGDDVSQTVAMPFDFPFYGEISDSITICTNGWISLQPTWETYFRNWNIPSALGPYGMIAAYWDDLIGFPLGNNEYAKMRICYEYIEDENIFVIEWNKCVNRFDYTSTEKFEIVLYDPTVYPTTDGNGIIQINYHTANNPDANNNYSTVGIENFTQSDGLLYTYANIYPASATQLCNNLAIKFTTEIPEFIEETTPIADFSAEITYGIAPLQISFINQTSPLSYFGTLEWQFGDESPNSSEIHPVHTYQEVGSYSVTLTATNSQGTDSITHDDFITVFPSEDLIWPGDTNIDGVVSIEDIIVIGIFWNEEGLPRDAVSFQWAGNDYPGDWDKPMASVADCNGDGKVNITDILGICLNWNYTHATTCGSFSPIVNLEDYRENFQEIYNSLENSGTSLLLKNYLAELFDFPIVTPIEISKLQQNYPNPFNPTTKIAFDIASEGKVELAIYNVKGQLVKKLFSEYAIPGSYIVEWNGKDSVDRSVSSGLYFYRLKCNEQAIDTKKMILLK